MYLGLIKLGANLTFFCNTHTPSTGAAVDADAAPGYRVYEDETATPLLTGSLALLDDANTTGFYSEQIAVSAANGFEAGKNYTVRITGVVGGVTGVDLHQFGVSAKLVDDLVDAAAAPLASAVADAVCDEAIGTHAGFLAKVDNLPAAVAGATGGVAIVGSIMGKSPATLATGDVTGNLPADVKAYTVQPTVSGVPSVDDIHDEVIEGTLTFRQAMRLILAVLTGEATGGGTTTITFRDIGDTKDRVVMTVDSSGNRSAVTRTGT
jgi:hypothetical protein